MEIKPNTSPMWMLESLTSRFCAFEAIAYSTIKLARFVSEDELSMDLLVANAVLEFGSDLRQAFSATSDWAERKGMLPTPIGAKQPDTAPAEEG